MRSVIPFIFIMIAFIALPAIFPGIVMLLPNKVG